MTRRRTSQSRSAPGPRPPRAGLARTNGRPPLALSAAPDLRHPAFLAAALVAAAGIVVSVSFALFETDMWQHLAVGRAIWTLHEFPTRQLWTWPTYGTPDVNAAWSFRLLIWWIWSHWGLVGLFAWRFVASATAPVTQEPANGSTTTSPGSVSMRMKYSGS